MTHLFGIKITFTLGMFKPGIIFITQYLTVTGTSDCYQDNLFKSRRVPNTHLVLTTCIVKVAC